MSNEVNIAIIGAGVIGLAIAAELAQQRKGVFVFEKNHSFALETSSRNSGVIHAGLYYPQNSLKTKLCLRGNQLLYDLCQQYNIGCNRLGKLIVASEEDEVSALEKLLEQGVKNGIGDLRLLSRREVRQLEPDVSGVCGLLSPSTGILDPYALARFFYARAMEREARFVFNAEVTGIEKAGTRYRLGIADRQGTSHITSHLVINCAGLHSDRIAQLVGMDIARAGYKLHYCKGEYFSLSSRWRHRVSRLVYPVPEQAGQGIHLTIDVEGRVRLGPNAQYVDSIEYSIDESHRETFYLSAKKMLPQLELDDLTPDFAGMRPKLQAPGEAFRDFVIAHEDKNGLPGFINLAGIESPGLTASPAIARHVADMVRHIIA